MEKKVSHYVVCHPCDGTGRYPHTSPDAIVCPECAGAGQMQDRRRNAGLVASMRDALESADKAMNPPDRGGISLHEWNQRLKAATKIVRAALSAARHD